MGAVDLCDDPSGCDRPGTVLIERPGYWHDDWRCAEHAPPAPATQCGWCAQTVRTAPVAGWVQVDDHNRPDTGRTCPGTGTIVGRTARP